MEGNSWRMWATSRGKVNGRVTEEVKEGKEVGGRGKEGLMGGGVIGKGRVDGRGGNRERKG